MSRKPFQKLDDEMEEARKMAVKKRELCCVYIVTGDYKARPKRKALAAMAKSSFVSIVPNTTYDEEGDLCPDLTA